MSELPESWVTTTLGQVVNYANNETIDPAQMQPDAWLLELEDIERDTGKVIERKTLGERTPKSAKNRFHAGDVLYGKLRPYLNKVVRADRDGLCSSEIIAISPGLLDKNYLFYSMRAPSFIEYVSSVSHGMRMPRLGTQQAKEAPFSLPPLAEQTRIARKLDELLAQVDTLKARIDAIPALLKRFRQSVLAAAVSGRLTEEWREERQLPSICEVELGTLIKSGPQNGLYKPSSAYGEGSKIIRIDGFYSGEIKAWNTLRSLEVEPKGLETWGIKTGDILINRVNSIEYLGKCALVRTVPEPTVFESNIMRISLQTDRIHPEYLMRYLTSEIGRTMLIAKAKHAVNQASINQGDVKGCKVPLPSLEEQTEIVRRVDQLFAFADQLESKVATAKSRIDHLTQSILAKAFRGELVPQNPNDEPASVLLDRIKAQRATAPKAKRARKDA